MSIMSNVASGYAFNEALLSRCVDGFEPRDWLHRAEGRSNHSLWLLGHLVATRRYLLRQLGVHLLEEPWEKHFAAGSKPGGPADDVPPSLLRAKLADAGQRLRAAFTTMTAAKAGATIAKPLPNGESTIAGLVRFLYFHEVYHLGQIGLLRRAVGRPGIA